uniref:phospholipid carrier-dependent glycosyltransferase n=1 Tax=Cephaloticoccus sp. TaxID=1985742 RepID=UPI00404B2AE8
MPGVEYRQAQTAISAHFIQVENNFSLTYPTPVLGKPWSIPLEFPFYQWTTVVVSNITGFTITKAGRAVSIACFYLCLPAVFLLLKRWKVDRGWRWLVLAVVVTCPFYIFYGRAVLIETMALMFALWFWVGFERAVSLRSFAWLMVAVIAGSGAGLVKVTTFLLYLIPAGVWAAKRLWMSRKDKLWLVEARWILAAVALPFTATLWWLKFANETKAFNPMAYFLDSEKLSDFTIGTNVTRFSFELWQSKWLTTINDLTAPQILFSGLILTLLVGRRRWREIGFCVGLFAIALLMFPVLYAYHDYYFGANTVMLLIALGLSLVALAESNYSRGLVAIMSVLAIGGQVYGYMDRYYPVQSGISYGGNGLSESVRNLTHPDEYVIVTGHDWNSMLPYYSRRRALMIRDGEEANLARLDAAFAELADEKLGALVIKGNWEKYSELIARAEKLGLGSTPFYLWQDTAVFLPQYRLKESFRLIEEITFDKVIFGPGVETLRSKLAGDWFNLADLRRNQRKAFVGMSP